MSHFVANSISISKDFKTFKVKGGDNNVVPRSNYWTGNIPIENLFYDLNSGGIRLTDKSEKALFILDLVHAETLSFGGNWDDETDYWHMKHYHPESPKVINFDKQFLEKLVNGLKGLGKKEWIVSVYNSSYILKKKHSSSLITDCKEKAEKFSFYRAKYVASLYNYACSEIIKIS